MKIDHHVNSAEDRALAAYFRFPGEAILDQPSGGLSGLCEHQGRTYVVLRNGYRVLAVYRVRADFSLKRMTRWPKAIDENS